MLPRATLKALRFFADLKGEGKINQEYRFKFQGALYDDLNTPEAIAKLIKQAKDLNH